MKTNRNADNICSLFGCVLVFDRDFTCTLHTYPCGCEYGFHTICVTKAVPQGQRNLSVRCGDGNTSGDTFSPKQAWVCFRTKRTIGQMLLKTILGYSRHRMTSLLYRTQLFPFSFHPIDWALFSFAYLILIKEQQSRRGQSWWELDSPEQRTPRFGVSLPHSGC